MGDRASSSSTATCRFAQLYQVDEAQILLENLPSDFVQLDSLDRIQECPEETNGSNTQVTEEFVRKWKKHEKDDCSGEFQHPEGPKEQEFEASNHPIDFFLKFWDSNIENNILTQSNLFVNQKQRVVPVFTLPDLRGFFGLNIVMGYHTLPSYKLYWSNQPDLAVPLMPSTMSKTRFEQFLSNLHVNDDADRNRPAHDKLWKLRPLLDSLNNNFIKFYDIKREQSIDESMILFKGRSCLKQYCPMKPIKRGFKMWVRADSDGYMSSFEVYQGKGTGTGREGFGLGESVVLNLCEDILGKGQKVFFDNYFTSLPILAHLCRNETWSCGTIRSNRKGLPAGLTDEKDLNRGDFDFRSTVVNRTQKDGTRAEIQCPQAIFDYNVFMGGVDKADMLCGLYGVSRKSKKWWHRMFFGLIDRTLVNAFIVHSKLASEKLSLLNFLRSVALSLVALSKPPRMGRPLASPCPSPVPGKKRRKNAWSVSDAVRLEQVGLHYIVYKEDRGRCEVCSSKGIQSRPHSKCHICDVFLCSNGNKNCFLDFHGIAQ
ncbi:hypothetical protein RRG08_055526 [Elysia crispata]|uniref:PiggyBac transposable element-derived protein domain-containing protein n=1 Tax=Elysia crispata TaxID=231223 RepID=A0AAE1E3H3_9GAST|nr:hypothetical protein RRG08_055526 [Elysia crispata]